MKCKFVFILFALCHSATCLLAQEGARRDVYEYHYDIPVFVDSIQESLTYPMEWGNDPETDFTRWRQKARAKVFECMQAPAPSAPNFDVQVLGEERRDGYVCRKLSIAVSRWYRVPAYILIPDGPGRHPAVNLLHDHGAHFLIGKEKMIRPIAALEDTTIVNDAHHWVNQLYAGRWLGDYLASHGFVVLSADAPLWGERGRREGVSRAKYDIIAGNMMMLGRNLCGMMHYDDIAITDYLVSLPCVDTTRVAAVGFSMGAYRAWMLSALTDHITMGVSHCWMVTTAAQLTTRFGRKENGGFANSLPGLRNYLDYPGIASLACPKPMLFINGRRDKLFPVPGVEDAFERMRSVWRSQGADSQLETYILDQPHECNAQNQEQILQFLQSH